MPPTRPAACSQEEEGEEGEGEKEEEGGGAEEEGQASGGLRGPPEVQGSLRSKASQPQPWPSLASDLWGL